MQRGNSIHLGSANDMQVMDKLPARTYILMFHPEMGFYLTFADDFKLPSKLYGNTESLADRFLNTFEDRPAITGILLSGVKGSGKSLAAKQTSVAGLAKGYPTIIINSAHCGTGFNTFISSIEQPAILIFDEFEKVYDDDQQEALLTFLDGTMSTKKLVILTSNDKYRVNSHMINRPGRLFYLLEYKGLDEKFIIEYCEDKLDDKTKIESIVRASSFFAEFNFDMLQALVEELNRYKESVKDALSILNVKFDFQTRVYYDIKIFKGEDQLVTYEPTVSSNPLVNETIVIDVAPNQGNDDKAEEENDENEWKRLQFNFTNPDSKVSRDLSHIVAKNGNYKVELTKQIPKEFDPYRYVQG